MLDQARRVRLELAADWLVMAAWLAWLKSRLLVPEDPEQEEDAEALAAALTDRLAELARMRAAAAWLGARPQLGREVFGRGEAESLKVEDRTGISAELPALLQAYAAARRRALARRPYVPKHRKLWTVQEALARLGRLVGALPDWAMLQRFLPDGLTDPVEQRAALASTLIAALETARGGGDRAAPGAELRPHPDPPPRRGRGIARCKSRLSRASGFVPGRALRWHPSALRPGALRPCAAAGGGAGLRQRPAGRRRSGCSRRCRPASMPAPC